jgi:dolichol-phosphate mannosyltransferase
MARTGELIRFIKFCLVGGSGVLVNFVVYWLLTRAAAMPKYGANAISFEASVISNFALNEYFTFHDRRFGRAGDFFIRLLKFNGISLVGLGLQQGCLKLFADIIGINDLVALVIGIALATLWNYFVNSWWTWK